MEPEIIDCEQGSEEWYRARMGIPTASMFATVMANGRGGNESKTRRKYLLQLAGEILTGEPMESFSNEHMERGKIMEEEARNLYAFQTDAELQRVGFIRRGKMGCSPDSLRDKVGMLEIKTALPHILIEMHLRGEFPPEHKYQCHGNLLVGKREWIDCAVYWPKMPLFISRVHRDDSIARALEIGINEFNAELAYVVSTMRKIG